MGKLFIIIGKSATGKDTVYKKLMEQWGEKKQLKTVVGYTTRPIRTGEINGVEYYFVRVDELEQMKSEERVIEQRTYHTVHGDWHYFTADDGQIDLSKDNYMFIATLAAYEQIRSFFGEDKVIPLYIEAGDKDRLMRSILREEGQDKPSYAEVCRRYLADEADFSEEELRRLGIKKRFLNDSVERCMEELKNEIEAHIG